MQLPPRGTLDVRAIRLAMPADIGTTQQTFADFIDVSVKTVRNWEQGRREPSEATRTLLSAIKRDPSSMVRIINAAKVRHDAIGIINPGSGLLRNDKVA